jgi:hypothetical protein
MILACHLARAVSRVNAAASALHYAEPAVAARSRADAHRPTRDELLEVVSWIARVPGRGGVRPRDAVSFSA